MKKTVLLVASTTWICVCVAQPRSINQVHAPMVVATAPADAYIGLAKMPNGELRHYNYGEQTDAGTFYLSSADSGMSWKRVDIARDMPYADTRSPLSGEYLRAIHTPSSVYVVRTEGGIDGGRTITQIDEQLSIMLKPPLFADSGRLVVIAGHRTDRSGALTYTSRDDGRTWRISNLVTAPPHQKGGFHLGVRWNHGAVEPTVAELPDGRLWMIVRTAQDRHYQSFSSDGGVTWSASEPSPFYGTITMPTFLRLDDGRLLLFWSNTTPLPERAEADGKWDDVFTNRNATHVAISSDGGKTWIGMRELFWDLRRNASDFASTSGVDKSVHQAQAIEVAPGKIVAAIGQHHLHRKIVAFGVDWLYETERENHFQNGLADWSTFKYKKGIVGHCGYNRIEGGRLVDHPELAERKALWIKYQADSSLVLDADGAVWNFPAAPRGELSVRVKMPAGGAPIELLLNDRWFNASDSVARHETIYRLALDRPSLKIKDDAWHTIRLIWGEQGSATVQVDGRKRATIKELNASQHGISYLHLLGGTTPDSVGVYIEQVTAKKHP